MLAPPNATDIVRKAPASRDAALLLTLPAGSTYTIEVSGVNNPTGEALLEIYEVFCPAASSAFAPGEVGKGPENRPQKATVTVVTYCRGSV